MKRNKLFFVAMPLVALCLTSCGEGNKVKKYLQNNGTYSDGIYAIYQSYTSSSGVVLTGLVYDEVDDIFAADSFGVVYDDYGNDMSVFAIAEFNWGKWKNADYYCEIEYKNYYFEANFYDISLGVCPKLNLSKAYYMIEKNTFPISFASASDLANVGVNYIAVAAAGAQRILNAYIDADMNLW